MKVTKTSNILLIICVNSRLGEDIRTKKMMVSEKKEYFKNLNMINN